MEGARVRPQQPFARFDLPRHVVAFHPAQDRRLQAAETEIERVAFHVREVNRTPCGSPYGASRSITGPPGYPNPSSLRDLVEGFARGIVARSPQQSVHAVLPRFEQMRVPSADDQSEGRELDRIPALPRFQNHRVNVAFDVVHGNQRNACRERNRFGIGETDQQRARQTRAGCCRDRIQIRPCERASSIASRTTGTIARRCSRDASSGTTPPYLPCTENWLATTEDSTACFVFDHRGRGFVARAFDRENSGQPSL